jgi:hypothetical protein
MTPGGAISLGSTPFLKRANPAHRTAALCGSTILIWRDREGGGMTGQNGGPNVSKYPGYAFTSGGRDANRMLGVGRAKCR